MMAFNNYNNQNRNTSTPPRPAQPRNASTGEILPAAVPADYVDAAEKVMQKIAEGKRFNQITTSKIRNLLSLISDVYDAERIRNTEELLPESVTKLQMMRVRVLYEAGRDDKTVEPFVKEAKLLEYIKGIGTSRANCLLFAHYMEALVAYHRYYHIGNER